MSLSSWLTYLEKKPKNSLEKCEQFRQFKKLTRLLNLTVWNNPVITVTGTNGKGSCVALLSTILKAAGYRVGSYTSPHLLHYNERIQINNHPVSDEALCRTFAYIENARKNMHLSYFEFSTLAALLLFREENLDIIILEVGIGGRLDAVNAVDNTFSMITSIDLDHTYLLGNTREAIAWQKSGIMRPNTPCVWGESSFMPQAVRRYARQLNTKLFIYYQHFKVIRHHSTWTWRGKEKTLKHLPKPISLLLTNAAMVLQTIALLDIIIPIPENAIRQGLQATFLPGRFQIIRSIDKATLILDVAHNPASTRLLRRNLNTVSSRHFIAVVGMLHDKDIQGAVLPLIDKITHWYIGRLTDQKSADPLKMKQFISKHTSRTVENHDSIVAAFEKAKVLASPIDTIIVFGSFRTVATILKEINRKH